MLKIVFVCCLVVILAQLGESRPSYLPTYETIEYAPTVLGYEHLALPAAVSHQSSTVVHEKRPYLRPIVEHAPLLKTYGHHGSYLPLSSYSSDWYEPGWNSGLSHLSYPSIYLK